MQATVMLLVIVGVVVRALAYLCILLAVVWCWFQWSYRDIIKEAAKLPTLYHPLPLLGHAYYTIHGLEEVTEFALQLSRDVVAKGISVVCFWCGPLPIFMIHGLEDIQKVFKTSSALNKPRELDWLQRVMGVGILTAPAQIWKITRKHINPLFHPRNVDQLIPTFNRNSRELVTVLSEHVGQGPVNVMSPVMDIALKSICHVIYGPELEFDIKSESFKGVMKVMEMIPKFITIRTLWLWLRIDAVFYYLYRKELQEMDRLWKNFTEAPLQITKANNESKKRWEGAQNKSSFNTHSETQLKGPLNLVDVYSKLQTNHPQFTDEDLKAEVVTLYGTGTDTTGAAVSTCLLALAQYQDMQDRLYREIISVVGPEDDVTVQDLGRMPYLDMVFKETMRWTLVIPYAVRKVTEDLKLSSCTVPAGNTIAICLAGVLMDPKFFPDPQKFNPDRFSPENKTGMEKIAFLPFSGGPRNCIGKSYAQLLLKTMLVHVLRRFRLSTTMDINHLKRKLSVTLVSSEGYNITLENRC